MKQQPPVYWAIIIIFVDKTGCQHIKSINFITEIFEKKSFFQENYNLKKCHNYLIAELFCISSCTSNCDNIMDIVDWPVGLVVRDPHC